MKKLNFIPTIEITLSTYIHLKYTCHDIFHQNQSYKKKISKEVKRKVINYCISNFLNLPRDYFNYLSKLLHLYLVQSSENGILFQSDILSHLICKIQFFLNFSRTRLALSKVSKCYRSPGALQLSPLSPYPTRNPYLSQWRSQQVVLIQ